MDIKEFAKQYRVRKPVVDECGDLNIVGMRGDIYVYDDKLFAASILRGRGRWSHCRGLAKALGLRVTQNGDGEGTFLFDPADSGEADFAIWAIRAPRRRRLTGEQIEALIRRGDRTRFKGRQTQSGGRVEGDLDSGEES